MRAFGMTKLLGAFLFEVSPADPLTYLLVVAVLLSTTLIASYAPARRAASIESSIKVACKESRS